jgi:NAD(P)H-hydrate epimerase
VVGSSEKPGAGMLASFAALRAGAGLSTAAVSAENRALYVQAHPEVMTLPADRLNDLLPRLEEFSCVLAGPGLGGDDRTLSLVSMLLQNLRRPLILDADAVNALANNLKLLELERPAPLVLTPHPGEFSRLTGWTPDQIRRDRIERAREFARRYRLYLVLKGHHTVVAAPEGGTLRLNPSGNPGLATAGSGDVLGGVIAGLIAQFYPRIPLDRLLAAAVFLHGYAADRAVSRVGEWCLTAGDVLAALPEAFLHRHEFRPPFQLA